MARRTITVTRRGTGSQRLDWCVATAAERGCCRHAVTFVAGVAGRVLLRTLSPNLFVFLLVARDTIRRICLERMGLMTSGTTLMLQGSRREPRLISCGFLVTDCCFRSGSRGSPCSLFGNRDGIRFVTVCAGAGGRLQRGMFSMTFRTDPMTVGHFSNGLRTKSSLGEIVTLFAAGAFVRGA